MLINRAILVSILCTTASSIPQMEAAWPWWVESNLTARCLSHS